MFIKAAAAQAVQHAGRWTRVVLVLREIGSQQPRTFREGTVSSSLSSETGKWTYVFLRLPQSLFFPSEFLCVIVMKFSLTLATDMGEDSKTKVKLIARGEF